MSLIDAINQIDDKIDNLMFMPDFKSVSDSLFNIIQEIAEEWEKFVKEKSLITELSPTLKSLHETKIQVNAANLYSIKSLPLVAIKDKLPSLSYSQHRLFEQNNMPEPIRDSSDLSPAYLFRLVTLNYLTENEEYNLKLFSESEKSFRFVVDENLINAIKIVYPGVEYSKIIYQATSTTLDSLFLKGVPSIEDSKNFFALDYFLMSSFSLTYMLNLNVKRIHPDTASEAIKDFNNILGKLHKIAKIHLERRFGTGNNDSYSFENISTLILSMINIIENMIERLEKGLSEGLWMVSLNITGNQETLNHLSNLISGLWSSYEGNPISFLKKSWTNVWTTSELALFFGFPEEEKPGIRIYDEINFSTNPVPVKEGVELGSLIYLNNPIKRSYKLPLKDINKHIFIAGVTGSGKTTTVMTLLYNLWEKYKIPFLVIEPAKSEYKNFVEEIGGKYIDPVKDNNYSMNFLEYPDGIEWLAHADYLKTILLANFNLPPFHTALLESSLYDLYDQDFEKNLESLIKVIEDKIDKMGLSERTRNEALASLDVRLGNLMRGYKKKLFSGERGKIIDFKEILKEPTVINLANITADYEKALIMSILLVYLYEYNQLKGYPKNEYKLDHVTVVEEAHRILGKNIVSLASMTLGEAQKGGSELMESFFTNLLAEIRAYGEGLIIAEQLPSKISADVVKQTGTKIIHKLISYEDRKLIGDTMGLNETQIEKLILLDPGEALIFSTNTPSAIKVKINMMDIVRR